MTKRNSSYDNAKAFAIFVVVLAHMLRNGRYFSYLVPASVPVFFMLSGITYHHNKSFISFLKRKISTIVLPYLFAGIVSIIIFAFLGHFASAKLDEEISTTNILQNIVYLFYASAKHSHMKWNNSLWFLPCLMIIMLIVYLIENIVLKIGNNRFHKLIIRILLSCICLWTGLYISRMHGVYLPWHIETALCNVIFTEAGIVLAPVIANNCNVFDNIDPLEGIKKDRFASAKKIVMICSFFIAAIILAYFNGESSARTDEYGKSFVLYFFSALLFSLAFIYMGSLLANTIPIITYAGMNTLPVLLWNKYPIIIFQTLIGRFSTVLTNPDSVSALTASILPSIIVVAICLIIGYIQKKIIPVTLGIKKARTS